MKSQRDGVENKGRARNAPREGPQSTAGTLAEESADATLAAMVAAWPSVPEAIRRAVLVLVESTSAGR
jgi:hypothetical protein